MPKKVDKSKHFAICYDIRINNKTYQTIADQLSCSKQYIYKIARLYSLTKRTRRSPSKPVSSTPFVLKTVYESNMEKDGDTKEVKTHISKTTTHSITALQLKMIYFILSGKSISATKRWYKNKILSLLIPK